MKNENILYIIGTILLVVLALVVAYRLGIADERLRIWNKLLMCI